MKVPLKCHVPQVPVEVPAPKHMKRFSWKFSTMFTNNINTTMLNVNCVIYVHCSKNFIS